MLDQSYLDAIKGFEGYAPTASWDYKQHSNGYGTRALYAGEQIDRDTAEQRFQAEIAKAAAQVDAIAPNAPPGARAALVSLTYNAGPGWTNSGLGEIVRAGDWQGAAERLQQYNKAGGQELPALVKRRAAEAAWFNNPPGAGAPLQVAQASPAAQYPTPPIPPGSTAPPPFAPSGSSQFPTPPTPPSVSPSYFSQMPAEQAVMQPPPIFAPPRKPPNLSSLRAALQASGNRGFFNGRAT